MPCSLRRLCAHGAIALLLSVSCAGVRSTAGGGLEPRFVAVHNTLSSMGLAQVGPIHEGMIGEGKEERTPLTLPAGCFTIVVMASAGVQDLAASLLDAHGTPIAHEAGGQAQAVLRPCLDAADTYALAIKAARGTGSWVAETWAGGSGASASTATAGASMGAQVEGTCDSPLPLSTGVVAGSTTRGESNNAGSCGPSDANEIVYTLTATGRTLASFDVEAEFDSVLYVRKADCADANAEVECNDDSSDRKHSHIDTVLEPGKYFLFVDGYGHEGGDFKLTVSLAQAQALIDRCRRPSSLTDGVMVSAALGTNIGAQATCGGGAQGPDATWRAEIPARARVRIVEHSDDAVPVVHVRRSCADAQSEVACGESGAAAGDASVTGVFEAGTYYVFAGTHERDAAGRYDLLLQTAPPAGAGSTADTCADAIALPSGPAGSIDGDTFSAGDDVSGSCGGAGAADVLYRFEVAQRSLFVAALEAEEAKHLLILAGRCGDRSTEIACGRSVREVLTPGTYSLAIDGSSADAFGRFNLKWALRDVMSRNSACAGAPTLAPGRSVIGTTAGAGDRFGTLCGESDYGASGPDRVFKLVLAQRATVRLLLTATFEAVVALRKTCAEPLGGPAPELACESEADANRHAMLTRTLEAGTYWVVVDGQASDDQGPFTLEYHVQPLGG
jgi:hypothetical protein